MYALTDALGLFVMAGGVGMALAALSVKRLKRSAPLVAARNKLGVGGEAGSPAP